MRKPQRYLLLLACSNRKRQQKELLTASERYDGNAYRVIRKLRREDRWPFLVDVIILSAEYGLIHENELIPDYDRRMDQNRAIELRPQVLRDFKEHLEKNPEYSSVYVDLGKDYLPAIDGIENILGNTTIQYARGRIGERLSHLKQWLLEKRYEEPIVPFFVADRPMSLRILKGIPLQDKPGTRIGIMAHANTTRSFQVKYNQYPCEHPKSCDAIGGKECSYQNAIETCPHREYILEHTIKMCDSGMFTKEGATLSYEELFAAYERMGVKYGVMIDVMHESKATLESAQKAFEIYTPYRDKFFLVAVAQGKTVKEYLESYQNLKALGFTHIAVGGLLQRKNKTVRYAQVRDESFMYRVLDVLRSEHPNDWLFALGCFNPNRINEFSKRNVWGDYKGWIFQYEKSDDTLDEILAAVVSNELQHTNSKDEDISRESLERFKRSIRVRKKLIEVREETHQELLAVRREVRNDMAWLHKKLVEQNSKIASQLEPILTHVLLGSSDKQLVKLAIDSLSEHDKDRGVELFSNICRARELKNRLVTLDNRISATNDCMANAARILEQETHSTLPKLSSRCKKLARLVSMSEREYRFSQVRQHIDSNILARLTTRL